MVVAQQLSPLVELVVHQVTACLDLQEQNTEVEILVMNPAAAVAVVLVVVVVEITAVVVAVQAVGILALLPTDTPVAEAALILAVSLMQQ